MGLSADEKKLLEELTRRSQEPDADDDFEIEIFNGTKGARLPFSKGKGWLEKELGIVLDTAPPAAGAGDGQGDNGVGDGQGDDDGGPKYFRGRRQPPK